MIGDIIKEVRRQLIPRERKAVTGLPFGTETYGVPPSTDFATLSRDGYEKNALIYACINELASSASEAKLVVEKHKRQGWEPAPEHRLQKLMDNPNPLMSGYEFWFNTIIYLSLAGNCYWEEEPSKAGLIVGLWLMRPDLVSIKAIKTKVGERTREKIAAYEWVGATERITLPVDRVLHFKHPHPRDELYGFPPLAAAARQGDTDNYATDYVQSFFKNAAVPFGIFKVKGAYVDEAEAERVKARLRDMYGSDRLRWHDPLILGEETDWVEMGTTFKDMDFPQLRMITETRICEVFQVPPILVGSYAGTIGTTYENYKEARRSFWLETLMPTYKKHADTLNLQLVPQFGKDLRVIWDFSAVRALQESKDAAWARATAAFQAAMITRNMAWKEIGEEPIPGGDVFLQPMMLLPVEAGEKLTTKRLPDVATKSLEIPEEAKERWAKAIDMVARAWEGVFEKAAKGRLKEDKAALLKILRKEGKASTKAAPFETFMHAAMAYFIAGKEGWQAEFMPLMAGLMSAQADNILGAYGIAWDVTRPEVQEFLEAYSFEFAKGIVDVSEQGLRELVIQSQAEGWSVPTLRKAIEEDTKHYYDGVRAERIARTETIRSSNAGTQEAWREAGIEKKQWYTTFDGRQCGWCESMHEKVVSITSTFAEAGQLIVGDKTLDLIGPTQHPPLHPNCRCTILAYFEE